MVLGTPGPSIGAPNYVMVGRCVSLLDLEFLGVRRNRLNENLLAKLERDIKTDFDGYKRRSIVYQHSKRV